MRLDPFVVIRDLVAALHAVDERDATITIALQLLQSRLPAAAGMAWVRDPAGQWRLLGTAGDQALVAAALVDEPEPQWDQAGVVDRHRDGATGPLVRVRSAQGEPVAAMRLVDAPVTELPLEELLETAAELVGQIWERLAVQQRFDRVAQNVKVGSWEWQATTDQLWLSQQMYRNLGIRPEGFEHTLAGYLDRVHVDDREMLSSQVEAAVTDGGVWYSIHRVVTDDGEVRWIEGRGEISVDEHGVGVRLRGTAQDISERHRLQQEVVYREQCDQVTGLLNRTAFTDRLRRTDRGEQSGVVVALVEIDHFRALNRQVGWGAADRVLVEVAERLQAGIPEADAVARLAGDQFALLFDPAGEMLDPGALGQRIAACFEPPGPAGDSPWPLTVRVGVADGSCCGSSDELMVAAAIALEIAEERTNARAQVFDPAQHGQALQRLAMESDLRHAVEQGEIDVAYQPILDLDTGRVNGLEALARWQRPGHGSVSPVTFIPMAERAGLIHQLGAGVLARACRQLQTWSQSHPLAGDWYMAVNLSATQLDDPDLVEMVESTLSHSGLAHDRLVLEITETALSYDRPGALARLLELRRRGVRIAIDDFGTGYSSLSRLRELPFDILKIDQAFIQTITEHDKTSPILQALFVITQGLNLDVVAEGVETPIQLAKLKAHQCGFGQGFLFSRPLTAAGIEPLLDGQTPWDVTGLASQAPEPGGSSLQQLLNGLARSGGVPNQDTVGEILKVLAELTGLDSVYLTRIDLGDNIQQIVAAANTTTIHIEPGLQVPWPQTLCRRAIADGRQVIPDAPADYPDTDIATQLGIRSYVGVEIHGAKGRLRGTLCGVSNRPGDIPQHTVETLEWAARLLADPVEHRPADQ
jgi:predicted signal transduction protein with EAL and GGDEF domain